MKLVQNGKLGYQSPQMEVLSVLEDVMAISTGVEDFDVTQDTIEW